MEEEKATVVTNKQGSKKRTNPLSRLISVGGEGGGRIAGLVVFGGVLALAGYLVVASFARNKNTKAKKGGRGTHDDQQNRNTSPKSQELLLDECGCKGKEEDHALPSPLQHSTTQDVDAACSRWKSDINKSTNKDLLSTQTLILEEETDHKPNSEEENAASFHHQEIAFSDHSHPGSAASSNENGIAEDCLASLFNSTNGHAQEIEIYEPQDGLKSIELESEDSDIIDGDDDDDGVLTSGEEDSSKATGSTSLGYNAEPVWPAELMIQEPEPEFKAGYCDNNHVCSDCDADGSDYAENDKAMKATNEAASNKKTNFSLVLSYQPSVLTRTLVIPTLLLALLLFLVLLTRQESSYVLDEGSSVIVP